MQAQRILKAALPLVRQHGFTREALSLAATIGPISAKEPLSDAAVTTLFGSGEDARRTLISIWLEEGREDMKNSAEKTVSSLLKQRLRWNEPALQYLPEAFALMVSPSSGILPFDPAPAIWHAARIADEACYLSGETSLGYDWYANRATLAAAYVAAELHQLTSPTTAANFLDELLASRTEVKSVLSDTAQYAQFVGRSWSGIFRSLGLH